MLKLANPLVRWVRRANELSPPKISEIPIDNAASTLVPQYGARHILLRLNLGIIEVSSNQAEWQVATVADQLPPALYPPEHANGDFEDLSQSTVTDTQFGINVPTSIEVVDPSTKTEGDFAPLSQPVLTDGYVGMKVPTSVEFVDASGKMNGGFGILSQPSMIETHIRIKVPTSVEFGTTLANVNNQIHIFKPPIIVEADLTLESQTSVDLLAEPQWQAQGQLRNERGHSPKKSNAHLPLNPSPTVLQSRLLRPALAEVFARLEQPQLFGKSYGVQAIAETVNGFYRGANPGIEHPVGATGWRLSSNRTPKKVIEVHSHEIVDLLLPFLLPPLDTQVGFSQLFPANRRPFDYQIEGIKFLAERNSALLGDEMGLGKTIQAIVALQVLYRQGKVWATLILCPRSMLGTWERELKKWAPELTVLQVRGSSDLRYGLWKRPASVYLTTYETLRQDVAWTNPFQVILLDEVQKIKNPSTGMAQAVRRVDASVRWALSGTPLENKIGDVVSIFDYLHPPLFQNQYVQNDDIEHVKSSIAPYFLRRRIAEVRQELPDKYTNEIWLELTGAQRQTYQAVESAGRAELGKSSVTRMHIFALISKLKQICNLDPDSKESCKVDYLVEQLDAVVESGQKALVFSHLPHVTLKQIEPRLRAFGTAIFDGQLSDTQRERIINDFQNHDSLNVLLMSVQAGGAGITLTAASHVFHLDHWWNPATARQAEARAHRIGQTRTVFVHDLYTVGTIEQRIYELLKKKQHLFDMVIDDLSAEYIQGKFTDDDLFGLFDLKAPKQYIEIERQLRV